MLKSITINKILYTLEVVDYFYTDSLEDAVKALQEGKQPNLNIREEYAIAHTKYFIVRDKESYTIEGRHNGETKQLCAIDCKRMHATIAQTFFTFIACYECEC